MPPLGAVDEHQLRILVFEARQVFRESLRGLRRVAHADREQHDFAIGRRLAGRVARHDIL
jgi:hypothetical protein